MGEKSAKRTRLEATLAEDPDDPFLRYGLAMQCLREGDVEEGRERLKALVEDRPDDQVAAYQQLGQSFMDEGEHEAAREWLRKGIAVARARGDAHAEAEMSGFLSSLG
jgi:thioredoxin-like negative regulator of GroEL